MTTGAAAASRWPTPRGNALQYNADKKYKEAVAERSRAPTMKGQTCASARRPSTGKREGLVRMCVPRDGGVRARVVSGGAGEDFAR